jgi:hypothetical protein
MACWGNEVETSVNSEILEPGVSYQEKELAEKTRMCVWLQRTFDSGLFR